MPSSKRSIFPTSKAAFQSWCQRDAFGWFVSGRFLGARHGWPAKSYLVRLEDSEFGYEGGVASLRG
jgi:hypothetical protein